MNEFSSMERDQLSTAIKKETERQRNAEANKSSYATSAFDNYASGNFQNTIYGTAEERARQAANLNQVGLMTGHTMEDIGRMNQDYFNSLQQRRRGEDATARRMLEQRNRNVANVGRSFSGRGVAGGVTSAAVNEAQTKADLDVASQMQTFSRQNDRDLWDGVKREQKVKGEALAMGLDQGLADQVSTDSGSGTRLCWILVAMGLMSSELYAKEKDILGDINPIVVSTYQEMVKSILPLMYEGDVAKTVAPLAIAWVEERTKERPNLLGKVIRWTGEPLLYVIGRTKKFFRGV